MFEGVVAALLACCGVAGCTTVGPNSRQTGESIDEKTYGPSQTRMVDTARGSIATVGTGPTAWKRVDADGVETISSGQVQRTLLWDGSKFVFDSGTDITASGVEIKRGADGTFALKMERFSTLASEPVRAGNEAEIALKSYFAGMTEDQKAAHLADLAALQASGDAFFGLLLRLVSGL